MGGYDVRRDILLSNLPRTSEGLPRAGGVVIHDRLGKGGMGAVYLGFDENLAIEVAVKVLTFEAAEDRSAIERFFREARSTFRVDHSNVVRVLTVAEEVGTHYLVMEFVDGESADARVKREGPAPERDALEIVVAAGEALNAAHAEGILHRDVKPANILIRFRDGRVKLADLGLAKALGGEGGETTGLTATGQMLGTPAYMSPEQAEDASRADERSDTYSLGATLYTLLTGETPFKASQLLKLLMKVTREEPEDLRKLRPEVTEKTAEAVKRLMAKGPAKRPETMREAVGLLSACLNEAPAEGARGLARTEMAGKRRVEVGAERGHTPRRAQEETVDYVSPGETDGLPPGTPADASPAVVDIDSVVEKRLDVEDRRNRLEPGPWEGEAKVLQVVDRELRVARETEAKDPAAALSRLERAAEALAALEERKRVVRDEDLALLEEFKPDGWSVRKVVAELDDRLRSGRYGGAAEGYGVAAGQLREAVAKAMERLSEHKRVTRALKVLKRTEAAHKVFLERFNEKGHKRYLDIVRTVSKAIKAAEYGKAEAEHLHAKALLDELVKDAKEQKKLEAERHRLRGLVDQLKRMLERNEEVLSEFYELAYRNCSEWLEEAESALEKDDLTGVSAGYRRAARSLNEALSVAKARAERISRSILLDHTTVAAVLGAVVLMFQRRPGGGFPLAVLACSLAVGAIVGVRADRAGKGAFRRLRSASAGAILSLLLTLMVGAISAVTGGAVVAGGIVGAVVGLVAPHAPGQRRRLRVLLAGLSMGVVGASVSLAGGPVAEAFRAAPAISISLAGIATLFIFVLVAGTVAPAGKGFWRALFRARAASTPDGRQPPQTPLVTELPGAHPASTPDGGGPLGILLRPALKTAGPVAAAVALMVAAFVYDSPWVPAGIVLGSLVGGSSTAVLLRIAEWIERPKEPGTR